MLCVQYFQTITQKVQITQPSHQSTGLELAFLSGIYLFQLNVLLKPNFNCASSFVFFELIELKVQHKILYYLLQMLLFEVQEHW